MAAPEASRRASCRRKARPLSVETPLAAGGQHTTTRTRTARFDDQKTAAGLGAAFPPLRKAPEILWPASSSAADVHWIEWLAVLIDGERDAQHLPGEHIGCGDRAQAFGELRLVVGPPRCPLGRTLRTVKEQTPLLRGSAFCSSGAGRVSGRSPRAADRARRRRPPHRSLCKALL